ncbi:hypothetical protein A3J15_02230 [Candidatus Roizmanbacteria bacterium RIFCSPLOWO2_02_FULL_38_10]|uniref:Transcription elongation factor GreA n=1 Tax=Candidatus Roizmanbacteria bacterium RIFCSPLOWO2_02_FULL_38_10 TaxID=1802074 RepID=A0A1F7JMA2_9BACT|nr:MAG: hypothetical protein A3J15_02230 [Candidatus Roizmanbacteria bacterium RIFCSPLOWO2_02_FULL_38_10]
MSDNKIILTKEGFDKLNQELDLLKNTKRPQAVESLKKAREMGDLSENSAYSAAKEELSFVDSRIIELEAKMARVEVMTENNHSATIGLGSTVQLSSLDGSSSYTIVNQEEADISKNKLSNKSPLGAALIGKKKNDLVDVVTPVAKDQYRIVNIK